MGSLLLQDLDDGVIAALEARAEQHRRSLAGEVKAILVEIVSGSSPPPQVSGHPITRHPLHLRTVHVGGAGTFSRDDIYDDSSD